MKRRAIFWVASFGMALGAHAAAIGLYPAGGAASPLVCQEDYDITLLAGEPAPTPPEEPAETPPAPVEQPDPVDVPPPVETPPEPVEAPPEPMPEAPAAASLPAIDMASLVSVASVPARPPVAASRSSTAPAGAGAGAPGDGSDDPTASYAGVLKAWIERYKSYPFRARSKRLEGIVQVSFSIDRRGALLEASVVGSSGHRILDKAALSLLNSVEPLPPPPSEVTGDPLFFVIPISYTVQ